jgi:cobalt-zinc-cadmium efflux system protein
MPDTDPHLHPPCDFGAALHARPPRVLATRQLSLVILITAGMMVAEIVGGLLVPSVALLADAGHMLTHLIALALAYFAIRLTVRPVNLVQTYGFYRVEILAALFNALTILLAVAYILYDAVLKFVHPPTELRTLEMIAIAAAGLAVNLAGAFLLNKVEGHDINIRGAMIHLLSDTLSSVAVVAGGVVMHYTHWYRIDPVLAVVIAAVIVVWGWRLFRSAVRVLLESAPEGMDVAEVCRAVEAVPGVEALHDAHVWEITSDMVVMTGHLLVKDRTISEARPILDAVNRTLSERFHIGHTTFQLESVETEKAAVSKP